jgi:hypothetical protein
MVKLRNGVVAVVAIVVAVTLGAVPAGAQGPPPNDDFANRIDLGSATSVATPGSTVGAVQFDPDEAVFVPNEPGLTGRFVWWTWRAPTDGQVRVFTENADYFSALWVYTGTPSSSASTLPPVEGVSMVVPDRDSGVEFRARAGQQYQIALGAEFLEPDFDEGTAVLRLELVAGTSAPPAPTITDVVANTYKQKLVVSFTPVRNAKSYEISYNRPGFSPNLASVFRSPGHVQGVDTRFVYEVRVRGVTARGVQGAWSDAFIVEPLALEAFGARQSDRVIFIQWFPLDDASQYRVYVTDLHSGRQRLFLTTQTEFTYTTAVAGRSYEIEVWAMRPGLRTIKAPPFTIGPFDPGQ